MKPLRHLLPISLVALAAAGCSRVPSRIIQPEEMAALMADMEMGDAVINSEPGKWRNDSLRRTLLQSIYAAHDVTGEQVDSSLVWYGHNVMEYKEVCDRMVEILEKRVEDARTAGVTNPMMRNVERNFVQSADGDSVDLWIGPRWRRFTASQPSRVVTFSQASDSHWEPGDRLTLRFKTIAASPGSRIEATTALRYQSTDTISYIVRPVPLQNGWTEVAIQSDPRFQPARVFGAISVTLPSTPGAEVWLDSLSLVREHKTGFASPAQQTATM